MATPCTIVRKRKLHLTRKLDTVRTDVETNPDAVEMGADAETNPDAAEMGAPQNSKYSRKSPSNACETTPSHTPSTQCGGGVSEKDCKGWTCYVCNSTWIIISLVERSRHLEKCLCLAYEEPASPEMALDRPESDASARHCGGIASNRVREESVREERGGCGGGGYSEGEIAIGNIATPTSSKLAFATSPRSTQAFATVCNLCGEDLANLSKCLVSEHEAACFRRLVAEEEKGGAGFLVACNLCGLSFQDMCANERWTHEEECLRRFEADGWDSEEDTYSVKLTELSKADTLTERLKTHVDGGQGINTHTHTCAVLAAEANA